MKSRIKQIVNFSILLFISASFLAITGCGETEAPKTAPPVVQVMKVANMDVPIAYNWVGQTYGADDVEIRARVSGWLQQIHFREGSEVKKGQLLYTIDASEIEQKVSEARSNLAAQQTLLVQAEYDIKRYQPLSEAGAVSKRTYEMAVAEYNTRKEQVDAAKANLRLIEIDLGYAKVTAPISGLIGISNAAVGDYVGGINILILNTISRIDSISVRFSITEQEYLRFLERFKNEHKTRTKIPLQLTLANGSVYDKPGYVNFTERQFDAATGTLQFDATFPNPERFLRPGQFARISAIVEKKTNAVVVPTKCLVELQGKNFVYVVGDGNRTFFRPVILGPRYENYTVIEQGLTPDELVVVDGIQKIKPDIIVSPNEVPRDTLSTAESK